MNMLYRRSQQAADEVIRWATGRFPTPGRLLDLGGGHGRYAHEFQKKGWAATLFDRRICVDLARERHGGFIEYRAGDFMRDDLGQDYDLVFLSNIVHGLGPAENLALLARVAACLAPGGMVVIKDMFLDESRANPVEAVFFNVVMLLYTREGLSYSVREMEELLSRVELDLAERVYIRDQSFSLLCATRSRR
jgi:SAM-dependent methyltransferase